MTRQLATLQPSPVARARKPGRIKAALLSWIGVPISLTDGSFWSAYAGGTSASGECVSVDKALQLSTVWACVRIIAQTIATLPLNLYERDGEGRKSARQHPLYELIHLQPNADMTAVELWEAVLTHLLLWGNAFVEKRMLGGRVVALDLLLPERMGVKRNTDGELEYRYLDFNGQSRPVPEGTLMHIRAFSLNGVLGLSPIGYARHVFGGAIAADKAAGSQFANGLRPQGVFEFDQFLKPDQREEFEANVLPKYSGAINSGQPLLLELGIKYKAIAMNPDDAQLLESRAFNVEEICRWFGVPPFMVGHTQNSTSWGTGIEQQQIAFLQFTLRPWLTRIEQSIRRSLLLPAERDRYFAEFAIEGLLRGDSAARAAFLSQMTQNGLMTRNEGRSKENLPPMPGGDKLTVQTNLTPLDQLGQGDAAAKAREALRAFLGVIDAPKNEP